MLVDLETRAKKLKLLRDQAQTSGDVEALRKVVTELVDLLLEDASSEQYPYLQAANKPDR